MVEGQSSLDETLGVGLPFFPRLHSLAALLASGEGHGRETTPNMPTAG